jgi:lipid II:glycine glycyltransferase (peptidoglycan interpeptide bridge formation enzyme)
LANGQNFLHILVERHNITGIRAFSEKAFAKQMSIPGMVMFKAVSQDVTVGLDLWYVHGDVAYVHLVGLNPLGYDLRASYALKWYLIKYFADKVRWLDLGGVSGLESGKADGLIDFKKGWSSGTRITYLCGRIFDPEKYAELVKEKDIPATSYFPAYRKGEFG